MAIRAIEAPARVRTRDSKYKFTSEEIAQTVELLEQGNTVASGEYKGNGKQDKAEREARSSAQALKRAVLEFDSSLDVGTRSWYDADEKVAFGAVKLR